jgi:oligoribonuclease
MKPEMIWVDVETTGLDENKEALLEVGIILTDRWGEYVPSWEMSWLINEPLDEEYIINFIRDTSPETQFVRDMHTKSGLFSEWSENRGYDFLNGQRDIANWLTTRDAPLKAPMCGSSVLLDRLFLRKNMPGLEASFHYRNIDVSGIREIASLVNPRVVGSQPVGSEAHRPLADLHDSIDLYRHFLDEFFFITNEDAHNV